jgi:glycerophosphoryl diester phosphodiesterase
LSRLYAHRGAAAEEPENTLPSFQRAASYGVHALEMDVHMTKDGVVVVAHDTDGQRMCRQSRAIKHTSYADLKAWDAGWGFVDLDGNRPFADKGYRIPQFADVLDHFPDLLINVDLKQKAPSMVSAVLKIVRDAGAQERVILASFSQATLLHLRYRGYKGITAMGVAEVAGAIYGPSFIVRRLPYRGLAAQIPTRAGKRLLATPKNIARIQKVGARVDFWTINDPEEAQSLLAMGADGIMTDDPKALAPLFQ